MPSSRQIDPRLHHQALFRQTLCIHAAPDGPKCAIQTLLEPCRRDDSGPFAGNGDSLAMYTLRLRNRRRRIGSGAGLSGGVTVASHLHSWTARHRFVHGRLQRPTNPQKQRHPVATGYPEPLAGDSHVFRVLDIVPRTLLRSVLS